jgi:putative spermidine/putrescine transport system permease protein
VVTLENYAALWHRAFLLFFLDTFRLSILATIVSVSLGYLLAYTVARGRAGPLRTGLITLLISMLFIGGIVRVYALALSLGPVGALGPIMRWLDIARNDVRLLEASVVAGIAHYTIPIVALTLWGTINNIDPRLAEAAESLGAPRWKAFLGITVMLSVPGLISAFLLGYALAISAFTVPLFLGKGFVVFVTMLIYQRFSEIPNFPGGSAIAVVMLVLSIGIVYAGLRVVRHRFEVV